jgi:hypothetical protein
MEFTERGWTGRVHRESGDEHINDALARDSRYVVAHKA